MLDSRARRATSPAIVRTYQGTCENVHQVVLIGVRDEDVPIRREELVVRDHRVGVCPRERALCGGLAVCLRGGTLRTASQNVELPADRTREPPALVKEACRIMIDRGA